eukprot:3410179-Pyramimonas_sp.AAC.1
MANRRSIWLPHAARRPGHTRDVERALMTMSRPSQPALEHYRRCQSRNQHGHHTTVDDSLLIELAVQRFSNLLTSS